MVKLVKVKFFSGRKIGRKEKEQLGGQKRKTTTTTKDQQQELVKVPTNLACRLSPRLLGSIPRRVTGFLDLCFSREKYFY